MGQRGQRIRQAARSGARLYVAAHIGALESRAGSLEPRVVRRGWTLRREVNFRYDLAMSGEVDRAAWARVVQRLLDDQCKGNKSAFARKVIVDGRAINPRTVYAWLAQDMTVRDSTVRAVAAGFGLNPIHLLAEVGVYPTEELHEQMNEERRRVLDSDLDDDAKAEILRQLDEMEAADEALIEQLREKDRQRRADRVTTLIEQRRGA